MASSENVERKVGGSNSLEILQTVIQQQEQELGPLVALGNNGSDTLITFDQGQDLPGMIAELEAASGQSTIRPGFLLVARGECVIGGNRVSLAAIRPIGTGILQAPASEEAPAAPTSPPLGRLSIKYETGGRGPGTVSIGSGDAGGVSYGSYQMTSSLNGGCVIRFVTDLRRLDWLAVLMTLRPGSAEFSAEWRKIAAERPEQFQAAQHEFIKRTHFDPVVQRTLDKDGLDVLRRSAALRDVVWSTAVQHGPNTDIISMVMNDMPNPSSPAPDDKTFDGELIAAIYAERGRKDATNGTLVHFKKNSRDVQAGVAARFVKEQRDALTMLQAFA
jgi:hypothetical protein